MSSTLEGLNPTVVVICSIAGAGGFCLLGYAITHRFFPPEKKELGDGEFSQAQYMREVRLRYAEQMANSNGFARRW